MPICYIGIGSNLGDRREKIELAIDKISRLKDTKVAKVSSIIETDPVSTLPQGKYLNAAIEIKTGLSARELLTNLQNIETELGRKRSVKNAPRTIDLDILLFDGQEIKEQDLTVPHPKMLEREFVLIPLREIAPEVVERLTSCA
ncbi:MAG: 2-amino-4-hydroxy-6-hydroxymethyldihydropteridine diphosphokinase [Candidatus Omnitrophota bacterium]